MAHLVRQVQDAEVELSNFTAQVGGPQAGDKQRAEDLLVNEPRSPAAVRAEELLVDPSFRAFTAVNAHTAAASPHTEMVSARVRQDAVDGSKADRERAKREEAQDKAYTDVTVLLNNDAAQAAVKLARENREERGREGPSGP